MSYGERFTWGLIAGFGLMLEVEFITVHDWIGVALTLAVLPIPFVMGLTRPGPRR